MEKMETFVRPPRTPSPSPQETCSPSRSQDNGETVTDEIVPAPSYKRRKIGMRQPSAPVNSAEDFESETLSFPVEEEPTLDSRQRPSRQSARNARALASEISKLDEEASEMIKQDRKKQRQDTAQREHEKFEEMAKEVMNVHIPLLEQSDCCNFMKRIETREGLHSDLIILDGPWGVNVNRSRDDAGKSIVAQYLPLVDEALHESCLLMRKVLAKNGKLLVYSSVEDLPRWRSKLAAREFQVQQSTISIFFAPSAAVFHRKPNAVYNYTHFVLRAWRLNETPVVNLMGNGLGHIPARSNVINNYMPVCGQNHLRGLDGKEVRVEEKFPEIFM